MSELRTPIAVKCPDCGLYRRPGRGPHAPHWRGEVLVDCIGRPIAQQKERPR